MDNQASGDFLFGLVRGLSPRVVVASGLTFPEVVSIHAALVRNGGGVLNEVDQNGPDWNAPQHELPNLRVYGGSPVSWIRAAGTGDFLIVRPGDSASGKRIVGAGLPTNLALMGLSRFASLKSQMQVLRGSPNLYSDSGEGTGVWCGDPPA